MGLFLGVEIKRGIAAVFRHLLFHHCFVQYPATRRGRVIPGFLTKTITPRRPRPNRRLTISRPHSRQHTQCMRVPFPPELHLVTAALVALVGGLQIHRLQHTGTLNMPVDQVSQTQY